MTLIYRVGDEVLLHAPREVLTVAAEAILTLAANHRLSHELRIFANSLHAEAQHPAVEKSEEWLDT